MRVFVCNPPFHPRFSRSQRSPAVTKSGTLYYPLWLAQAVAVLEEAGFETVFLDAPAAGLSREQVVARAREARPGLVVLETSTPSIVNDLEVAREIREALPGACLVLVGPHVSALPEETLRDAPWVDAIARREYEFTLRELAQALRDSPGGDDQRPDMAERAGLATIAGLSVRTRDGVVHAPDRPYLSDLDALPWVSRVYLRHLDPRRYFNPNAPHPMATLTTSRGCPHRCSFCVYPQTMFGHGVRRRSIDNVLDEVEEILHTMPEIRSIFFEDDTFTASRTRTLAFCEAIRTRGLRFLWTANARMDLDADVLRAMKEAGCRMLCVGFESGSAESLAGMGKGANLERGRRFMDDARRVGPRIHGCFILGFPGEDRARVEQTIQLALDLDPDTAQFYPVMVYPGTAAFALYEENGWLVTRDFARWLTPQGRHACVTRNEHLSPEELMRLCDEARRRFYLRPRFLWRRLRESALDSHERRRTLRAGGAFLGHLLAGGEAASPSPLASLAQGEDRLRASAIIPAYNAAGTLPHTLRALRRQTLPRGEFEVIVVDDGSTDATPQTLERFQQELGVRVLRQANAGPAAARNAGARLARGEILVFTDADCTPEPDFLERLLEPFARPEVAGAQGRYRSRQTQLAARFAQAEFESRYALHEAGGDIDLAATYAAAFRRDVFLEAGGFDTRFPAANNEDTEFSYRLLARLQPAGRGLVFAPEAVVWHLHPASLGEYCRVKFWRAFWRLRVYGQYPGKAARDRYTSRTVKLQTLAGMAIWLLALAGLAWHGAWRMAGLLGAGVAASALPWAWRLGRRDLALGLATPGFALARALALGLGTWRGGWSLLVRLVGRPMTGLASRRSGRKQGDAGA